MADPAYIVDGVLTDREAWVGIATTTLGVDAAVVTFTSPDDGSSTDWSQFMDLKMIWYIRGTTTAGSSGFTDNYIVLNNDTTSNIYAYQTLFSPNTLTVTAATSTGNKLFVGKSPNADATANVFGAVVADLFDINSGKYKSVLTQYASDINGTSNLGLYAYTYKSQAPLTEIDIYSANGSLAAGSMFSLFGVLPRMVA